MTDQRDEQAMRAEAVPAMTMAVAALAVQQAVEWQQAEKSNVEGAKYELDKATTAVEKTRAQYREIQKRDKAIYGPTPRPRKAKPAVAQQEVPHE